MLDIALVCNWGASTTMIANKIKQAADNRNIETKVTAYSYDDIKDVISSASIILLAPQVAFRLKDFTKKYGECGTPFMVIDTMDYGRMNGENVLNAVLKKLDINQ